MKIWLVQFAEGGKSYFNTVCVCTTWYRANTVAHHLAHYQRADFPISPEDEFVNYDRFRVIQDTAY